METGFGYSYAIAILFEHKARNVPGPFSGISGHQRGEMPVLLPSASYVLEDPVWTLPCSLYSAGPAQGLQRNRVRWEVCARLTVSQRPCFTAYNCCVEAAHQSRPETPWPHPVRRPRFYLSYCLHFCFLRNSVCLFLSL